MMLLYCHYCTLTPEFCLRGMFISLFMLTIVLILSVCCLCPVGVNGNIVELILLFACLTKIIKELKKISRTPKQKNDAHTHTDTQQKFMREVRKSLCFSFYSLSLFSISQQLAVLGYVTPPLVGSSHAFEGRSSCPGAPERLQLAGWRRRQGGRLAVRQVEGLQFFLMRII